MRSRSGPRSVPLPRRYSLFHHSFCMEHRDLFRTWLLAGDDGDIIELLPNKTIRKAGRIHVGNKLYDDAEQPVHEAVIKDRIHISREGIFVIVLTLNKKTGHLMKTPDIVSRAFIYLDNSEELIGKKSAGHYHAGGIYNCRCYEEPLLDIVDVTWPHKVYHAGKITKMSRKRFTDLLS